MGMPLPIAVPYNGASRDVNLGQHVLKAADIGIVNAAGDVALGNQARGVPLLDLAGNWARLCKNIDDANARAGVPIAGIDSAYWTNNSGQTIVGGETAINVVQGVQQDGIITSITVWIRKINAGNAWKVKIFQWQGGDVYKCIDEASFSPVGSGQVDNIQTFTVAAGTLSKAMQVKAGDCIGLYLYNNANNSTRLVNTYNTVPQSSPYQPVKYTGDVAVGASATFSTPSYGTYLALPLLATGDHPPYACWIGDSILGDGNSSTVFPNATWVGHLNTSTGFPRRPGGKPGNRNNVVPYRVSARMPANFTYQNWSIGGAAAVDQDGKTYVNEAALTTYILPKVVAADPKLIFIHFGYNDLFARPVGTPQTWEQISAGLDRIRALIQPEGSSRQVFLDEVLPTAGIDAAKSLLITNLNANYASYCATHGWTLVKCHHALGNYSASAAAWYLKPEYANNTAFESGGDGAHLSLAGAEALAAIQAAYLLGVPAPPIVAAKPIVSVGAIGQPFQIQENIDNATLYAKSTTSSVFNLPRCREGLEFELVVSKVPTDAGIGHSLVPQAYDLIVGNGFTPAAGKAAINTYATAAVGDRIRVKGGFYYGGSEWVSAWYITSVIGTWARGE